MGILNVTPDSFSDGGTYFDPSAAADRALQMVDEGAAIIDIGGESTRPGALKVAVREEIDRVLPVIRAIRSVSDIPISVDTSKAEVIQRAADAGADLVNDVLALRKPGALQAVAKTGLSACLMHMLGSPANMQAHPFYTDVVVEVGRFLAGRVAACNNMGITSNRLIIDPGFGFGKTPSHNKSLLEGLPDLKKAGLPILVGLSRKSWIGRLVGLPVENRRTASVTLAVVAAQRGADMVRVHDVAETRIALDVLASVEA